MLLPVLLAASSSGGAAREGAQPAALDGLEPGTRVRVSARGIHGREMQEGMLVRVTAEEVVVRMDPPGRYVLRQVAREMDSGLFAFPRNVRVEALEGRSAAAGALRGAAWGLGAGVFFVLLLVGAPERSGRRTTGSVGTIVHYLRRGGRLTVGVIGGGMVGGLLGSLVVGLGSDPPAAAIGVGAVVGVLAVAAEGLRRGGRPHARTRSVDPAARWAVRGVVGGLVLMVLVLAAADVIRGFRGTPLVVSVVASLGAVGLGAAFLAVDAPYRLVADERSTGRRGRTSLLLGAVVIGMVAGAAIGAVLGVETWVVVSP